MLPYSVDLNLFSEIFIHFSERDAPPNGWIVRYQVDVWRHISAQLMAKMPAPEDAKFTE